MNHKSNRTFGMILTLTVFILLGLAACAPATVDAGNTPLSAEPLEAQSASFETRLARIELNGTLEQITPQTAVVDGQTFRIDNQSVVVSALKAGDRVQVKAVLLPDNSLYAQSLTLDLSASPSSSFKFYGFVEEMGSEIWRISAITVQTSATTAITNGIGLGSFVEVEGRILNGQLLADKIALEDSPKNNSTSTPGAPRSGEVEFYGKVESTQNGVYVIGGRTVRTNASTEIKAGVVLGALVKVHATLQSDGSYLAREIELSQGDDNSGKSGDDDNSGDDNSGKGGDDDKGGDDNSGQGSGENDDDNSGKGGDDDDKGDDDYGKGKGK